MSLAHECDRCGDLFAGEIRGAVSIESIGCQVKGDGEYTTWGEIDLCPPCGRMVLEALGAAIQDNPTSTRKTRPIVPQPRTKT